jgi:hypothetical protein
VSLIADWHRFGILRAFVAHAIVWWPRVGLVFNSNCNASSIARSFLLAGYLCIKARQ